MVTDIRNMPALSQLVAGGVVPLFSGNDPGGIAAIQQAMAAAQGNAGLWIPADSRSPDEYVNWVKQLMAAAPQAKHVDLNMEAIATGPPGSPGWNYSEAVLSQLAPYLQGREWSVSPMANQDWYNYQAATSRGGQIWPQAYQGDMSGIDPQGVIDWVARNNVDPSMIIPLLGNARQGGFGNLYGIDLPGFRDPSGRIMLNPNQNPLTAVGGAYGGRTQTHTPAQQGPLMPGIAPGLQVRAARNAPAGTAPPQSAPATPPMIAQQVAQAVNNIPPALQGRAPVRR
jgi:hypothetical protein